MVSTPLLPRTSPPSPPRPSSERERQRRNRNDAGGRGGRSSALVAAASLALLSAAALLLAGGGGDRGWYRALSTAGRAALTGGGGGGGERLPLLPPVAEHPPPNRDDVTGTDYELAYVESFGYLDDVPSRDWEMMRRIALNRVNHGGHPHNPKMYGHGPAAWYQNNFDPDFSCRHDTKVGVGDGGKWVCDPMRLVGQSRRRMEEHHKKEQLNGTAAAGTGTDAASKVEAGCLVYSVGSEGNFQFEEGLADLVGPGVCEIHTFDFGDYGRRVPPNKGIHFHRWGLKPSYAEERGSVRSGHFGQQVHGNFKTLEETMFELGHEGRTVDIFKIDCEGCEWGTYRDWLHVDIRQVLLEVHEVPGIADTFFRDMQRAGFVTFHKEPNIQYAGGRCVEYAMLRLSPDFVENRLRDDGGMTAANS